MNLKIAYTIAGSDSSGGAGIQNDLKTFQSWGVHGCSVITAVTAQNNQTIREVIYLEPETIAAQLFALQKKFPPQAIKIGMVGREASLQKIEAFLTNYSGSVVLDPVLFSTSGIKLVATDLKKYLGRLRHLFTHVDVFTPNLFEAEKILNRRLCTDDEIQEGAEEILSLGVKSVLIKGGHFENKLFCQDYWTNGKMAFWLVNQRLANLNYRGSGCMLSAALTACLALGYEIKEALVLAKMYVNRGLRRSILMPNKTALLYHGGWPEEEIDLPYLTSKPSLTLNSPFPSIETQAMGLYPIIDSFDWTKNLLSCGVKLLQLRIKNKKGKELENEIKKSIALAKKFQAKLFINDYWDLALRYEAYGVHLGQDDLKQADLAQLRAAGLRLGISTHSYYEVACAHTYRPSYLACGPIFPTTSKVMAFSPQGLSQLKRWRRTLTYPLVAIGGLNQKNLPAVLATGADGVALISAITQAKDPQKATHELLNLVSQHVTNNRRITAVFPAT